MAILNFTSKIPGKEKKTFFREKIVKGLLAIESVKDSTLPYCNDIHWVNAIMITSDQMAAKIHTFRKEPNYWEAGTPIDFFMDWKTGNAKLFAPQIAVISTQKITLSWEQKNPEFKIIGIPVDQICTVMIDNKFFGDAYLFGGKIISHTERLKILARNDGFDTLSEFFEWFHEDFSGKIIHWTDLKY